jgi:hypothetical protein
MKSRMLLWFGTLPPLPSNVGNVQAQLWSLNADGSLNAILNAYPTEWVDYTSQAFGGFVGPR